MPSSNNCTWAQIKEFQQAEFLSFYPEFQFPKTGYIYLLQENNACSMFTSNETHTSKSEMEWISVNSQDKNNHFDQVLEDLVRHSCSNSWRDNKPN